MQTHHTLLRAFAPSLVVAACAAAFFVTSAAHAQTLSRGPYLQNCSTSAVTVRWRTSSNTDSVVRYGTTAGSLTQSVSNATAKTEHEIRLTGLAANTTYYYSVGNAATTLASGTDYFVVTAPAGAKPTRIWVLGDPGTGSSTQTSVRDRYYTFTGTRHTDLWLMLGDNAYSDGTDSEYTSKLFNIYPTMLRKSVLWATLGNHDGHSASSSSQTGPYYDMHTFPKSAEAGGVASGTEAYYSFDYGNIHFVCLNSYDVSRSSTGTMANWLRSDLAANSKDWLIAFFHHPPYSKGSHNSDSESNLIEMRTNLLPILEDYGVDLVLCGHSHSYERSKFIDGHYGSSTTFSTATHVKQTGSGQGAGAYTKSNVGPVPHEGAVYAVPGSSGQTSGGSLNHPAMYVSLNVAGSMVLDIDGNRLDALMLDNAGATRDSFTLLKGGGTPNVAPTATITSPANGATFTAPVTVTINATAADSDGTVGKVDFYAGSTLLGTDTASPYSFAWNAPAGTHSLTARATDNLNATGTSPAVSITVNGTPNAAPTVAITSPANGATFTDPASVTINATAADSDGAVTQVAFYAGSTLLATDTTSPYSTTWSAPVGTHSLTAVATDNLAAATTSTAVSITVNPAGGTPATVSFQNGTDGYNGMVDASLRSDNTTTNYGSATTLLADGSPDYSSVMKWDLSSIPAGKQITAATMTFNVVDKSSSAYEFYALRRAFVESEATWARASASVNWTTAGANSTSGDRESTVLGAITGSSTGTRTITLNSSGIAKLQEWVNSPAANYGFILVDYSHSNGLDLSSSEASTVSQRPKLTITYNN